MSRPWNKGKIKEILRKFEYERTSRHTEELLQPFKHTVNFLSPEEGTYNSLVTLIPNEIISYGRELAGNSQIFLRSGIVRIQLFVTDGQQVKYICILAFGTNK